MLDNANNLELGYSVSIPAGSNESILITSRLRECGYLQTAGKDHYEGLEERTAVELLLKSCSLDVSLSSTNAGEAQTIVKLLGYHALAIIQAGASISQGICDLGNYRDILIKQRLRVFDIHPRQVKSQYGYINANFEVTATYLSNEKDSVARDAITLLNGYAFMQLTDFPEKTFEEVWRNLCFISRDLQADTEEQISQLSPWYVSQLPNFIRQDSSGELDNIFLRQAQSLLASNSLIVYDIPTRMTRMHPVTHI